MASRPIVAASAISVMMAWAAACGSSASDEPSVSAPGTSSEPTRDLPNSSPIMPGTQGTPDTPDSSEAPGTSATPSPTATANRTVTLSFAGDVHFEGQLAGLLDDPATALAPIDSHVSAADLTILNLETAIGTGGTPEPGKRFTFQAPTTAFDALAAAGVDVVTMANNHALDYGRRGLADTLEAIASDPPLAVVGVGGNIAEAFAPAIMDVDGTTIAVLGASMADDPTADPTEHWAATANDSGIAVAQSPEPLANAVAEASSVADVVAVYLHWGVQGDVCPSDSQRRMAQALAGAGAHIVVGSHTHTLQGAGMLGNTFVAYGLGNFAWYLPGRSAMLTVTVTDGEIAESRWAAAEITSTGLPEFTGNDAAPELADRAACADLTPPATTD